MDELKIILERHSAQIKALEKEMGDMKEVQAEIRLMNESLIKLANELKHTNEHLSRHEKKIDEMDGVPKQRMQQTFTAIVAAVSGGIISSILNSIF